MTSLVCKEKVCIFGCIISYFSVFFNRLKKKAILCEEKNRKSVTYLLTKNVAQLCKKAFYQKIV